VPPKESPLEETKTITHAPEARLGMAGLIAAYFGVALTNIFASRFLAVGPEWFSQAATPEDVVRRVVLPEAFAGTRWRRRSSIGWGGGAVAGSSCPLCGLVSW
jgi:hypothetical protein